MRKEKTVLDIKRGDIYYADLSPVTGSEQGGTRPVLIIQNNIGNKYSPTVIVCVLTKKLEKADIPTHFYLGKKYGLREESVALLEQIRTIDKKRLYAKVGTIDDVSIISQINSKIKISLGL